MPTGTQAVSWWSSSVLCPLSGLDRRYQLRPGSVMQAYRKLTAEVAVRKSSSRFPKRVWHAKAATGALDGTAIGRGGLRKALPSPDVMEMWHFSHAVVTREFADEPGVIRLSNPGIGTRKYVTLSIPESVVLRVHLRLTQQALQSSLAARNPLRVIKLCNPHAAVAKQPAHITDLKSLQKPAHSARVSEPVRPAVGDTAA